MSLTPIKKVHTRKPSHLTEIDRTNELGALVAAAYLPPSQHAIGNDGHKITGTGTVVATERGEALRCDANDEGWSAVLPESLKFGGAISLGVVADLKAAPAAHSNIFGITLNDSDSSPYNRIQFKYDGINWVAGGENDAGAYEVVSTGAYPANTSIISTVSYGSLLSVMINGVLTDNSVAVAPTPNYGTNPEVALGDSAGTSRHPNADIQLGVVFRGELTTAQHRAFAENPWQIFKPKTTWVSFAEVAGQLNLFPLRRIRKTKPNQFTRADNNSPLTNGLSFLLAFTEKGGVTARDSLGNTDFTLNNGAKFRTDSHGNHLYVDDTNDDVTVTTLAGSKAESSVDGLTIIIKLKPLTTASSASPIASEDPGFSFTYNVADRSGFVAGYGYRLELSSGSLDGGTVNDSTSGGGPYWLVFKWNSTDGAINSYMYDAVTKELLSSDSSGAYTSSLAYGRDSGAHRLVINGLGSNHDENHTYFLGAWSRELSISEVEAIINNEHQLLKPKTIWVPLGSADAPVGGGVYTAEFYYKVLLSMGDL